MPDVPKSNLTVIVFELLPPLLPPLIDESLIFTVALTSSKLYITLDVIPAVVAASGGPRPLSPVRP